MDKIQMDNVETRELERHTTLVEINGDCFGEHPQPWRLRNSWTKPKRIRRKAKKIDLWSEDENEV